MTASGRARALVLAGLVVVSAVAVGVPALGERASAQAGGATLVVGGSGSYSSIQSAVDDATDGDTVEVRPGTYAESVTIRKNVTLVAPDGATIANASVSSGAGVLVFGPATPTVSGFTLRGWTTGFRAGGSEGAWTLRDTTIRDTGTAIGAAGTPAAWTVDDVTVVNTTGLSAFQSSGDWVVRDSTFRGDGISADESTGDWTVRDTVVRNDSGEAINAQRSDGRWTVENATLVDNERAVAAGESTGDWTVRDTVVDNATEGVFAENSGGNWTVRNVTVGDVGDSGVGATGSTGAWTVENATLRDVGNEAVAADATAGAWTVRNTTVRNAGEAVDASGATVAGDATRNYWGAADGPSGDFSGSGAAVTGNVSVEPFYTDAALTTLGTFDGPPVTGTLVVNRSDPQAYDSVQAAVDDAADTATVEIRPNSYAESVSLDKNVTVVAPEGATLDGAGVGAESGLVVVNGSAAAPTVDNVTVENFSTGVRANDTTGAWTLSNATVTGGTIGVFAGESDGAWTVRDTVVDGATFAGVSGAYATGPWTLANVTVSGVTSDTSFPGTAVKADRSSGAWTVENATFVDSDRAVLATDTTGAWAVHESVLVNNSQGVDASDAAVAGDATRNYWGAADGPSGDFPGSGDPASGNVSVEPFYTDAALTTLGTFGAGGNIVVNKSDPQAYDSIQNAVDNASDGDTVEVRPGMYTEPVDVSKNVTLVAPDGATVANTSSAPGSPTEYRAGVQVFGPATPTISGFTIEGWTWGFSAGASEGTWTLRDTTIRDGDLGIGAAGTPAAWTVDDVTVVNTTGLSAFQSSGDWVVRDSTFRRNEGAISADESTGDWTVARTTFQNDSGEAINAQRSDGRWTVENATLVDNGDGVTADESTGDWTVRDTVVDTVANDGVAAEGSSGDWALRNVTVRNVGDDGVDAVASAGAWTVRNTTVRNAGEAVDASDAAVAGDATRNYWGAADGPSGDFSGSGEAAVGNVSVEPFYTDAALTTLGTFGTGGASVANVTLANPAERTLEVTVTTTGPVSGLSVDLGNTTTTTGTDLALADGEFTETALGDGRYTYVASATADVADGTSSTYRASVTSVDGRAVGAGALQTSQSLSVAAARTTNGAATVRTGSTTVPEATVTLDGGVESNVTVSTADTVPDVPGQRETALRADLAAVDEDDVVVSALTVNVDREDADTPATLRLRVAADAVGGDPAGLVVARNDGAGYGTLDTAVVETSDDTVVLEARSPEGLSVFAVVDTDESLATTPTPDEGGGGGGGGGAAGAFAVDQRSVTERVDDAAVSSVTVEFDGETTGSVQIRAGESLPAGAPDPDGTVLTVVDVSPPADVADRPGRVTVTLARTAVGDVDPSRLRIVRYADGSLRPLSTRLVRADGRLVVLSAATAGYGSFAVVVGDQRTTAAPSATPDQTTTPGPTATPTPGSGPTATPTASPSPTPAAGDGFGVVAALVAVLAAALLVRRRAG